MVDTEDRQVVALVVEDDRDVLAQLSAAVESFELAPSHGTVTHCAEDLAAAVNEVDKRVLDVALLDLDLPGSEASDILQRFSGAAPELPMIVVTSDPSVGFAHQVVLAGAEYCLVKGRFGLAELESCLRAAVARRRRAREDRAREDSSFSQDRAVTHYAELVTLRAEERALEVDHGLADRCRELAGHLVQAHATARDLVDVHQRAVAGLLRDTGRPRQRALIRSAESVLVETMGHIATLYRRESLGRFERSA